MSISLDAIYRPLSQFFLQKFDQSEGASVFFRFAETPIHINDSDFVDPMHPDWGGLPARATEQMSSLVDGITQLDATTHGVWLRPSLISDLYHDEILGPSLAFLPTGLDPDAKQQVIDTFVQIKSDAMSRWENSKAASLLSSNGEFRPSSATPQFWWKADAPDVWTHQEFQIQGAATEIQGAAPTTPDQPEKQLLRMRIGDAAVRSILMQPRLQVARPIFAARMAPANTGGPQFAAVSPAAEPVTAVAARPDVSAGIDSDLTTRAVAMPLIQRIELQAVVTQSAPTQSVTVTDVTISFDYCLVTVARPWIQTSFLNSRSWFIPGQAKGSLSANDGRGVPALPTGFIALKNLSIKGPWTPVDITNLGQSDQFGPFLIESTVTNGAIGHAGIQVVGWILQDMPDLPPNDPPAPQGTTTTAPPAPALPADEPPSGSSDANVRLRNTEARDLPVFLDKHQPQDRAGFNRRWAELLADKTVLKQTVVVDGQVAGNILSRTSEGKRKVRYWIDPAFRARGVAAKAISAFLGLERIRPLYASVAKGNVGSIGVLQKCGFTLPRSSDQASTDADASQVLLTLRN